MLRKKVYDGLVRHGALLQGEARERYRQLTRQLSEKCLQYKNNVLATTTEFELHITPEHPEEVAVLALHSPPVTADVPAYLSAFSYIIPFAVDEDGSLSEALNASTVLPQTLILSPEGVVTYNQSGSLSYERLLELVEAAKG